MASIDYAFLSNGYSTGGSYSPASVQLTGLAEYIVLSSIGTVLYLNKKSGDLNASGALLPKTGHTARVSSIFEIISNHKLLFIETSII